MGGDAVHACDFSARLLQETLIYQGRQGVV